MARPGNVWEGLRGIHVGKRLQTETEMVEEAHFRAQVLDKINFNFK